MRLALALAALLALSAVAVHAQEEDAPAYDYTYEYNYSDNNALEETYSEDTYGYYADDDESYYEYYGYYADDFDGQEQDYYDYYEEEGAADDWFTNCEAGADGQVSLHNGTASCDVRIEGADKAADQLAGGIDGVYTIAACHNGKPLYKRKDSAAGQERTLWYSNTFGDWDVSRGDAPSDADVLLYGGEAEHADTPIFVSAWHLAAGVSSTAGDELEDDDFTPVAVAVACADGSKPSEPDALEGAGRWGPVLTAEEMEDKYRLIYDKYGKRPAANPAVNVGFVLLLAAMGIGIVMAVPYLLLRGRRGAAKGGLAGSFAAMLHASKKKSAGHIN